MVGIGEMAGVVMEEMTAERVGVESDENVDVGSRSVLTAEMKGVVVVAISDWFYVEDTPSRFNMLRATLPGVEKVNQM